MVCLDSIHLTNAFSTPCHPGAHRRDQRHPSANSNHHTPTDDQDLVYHSRVPFTGTWSTHKLKRPHHGLEHWGTVISFLWHWNPNTFISVWNGHFSKVVLGFVYLINIILCRCFAKERNAKKLKELRHVNSYVYFPGIALNSLTTQQTLNDSIEIYLSIMSLVWDELNVKWANLVLATPLREGRANSSQYKSCFTTILDNRHLDKQQRNHDVQPRLHC